MGQAEVRYWNRVGMYVTAEFAEEWIEKIGSQDGDSAGRYLEGDIEEFSDSTMGASSGQLRAEVKGLFEEPFQEVEIPPSTRAIIVASEMEKNKGNRIREYMAEGMEKDEAKLTYQKELDDTVCKILGIEPGSMSIKQGDESLIQYAINDYNGSEIFELKAELKDRGLDYKGKRDSLVNRLMTDDVGKVPLGREDQIVYGENIAEFVEALLDGRRKEEE
jgi:hypothetical protein